MLDEHAGLATAAQAEKFLASVAIALRYGASDALPLASMYQAVWRQVPSKAGRGETEGENSQLAAAVGRDIKGKVSAVMYAAAIPLSFVHVFIADAIYVIVALMWLVPDSRLERRMQQEGA